MKPKQIANIVAEAFGAAPSVADATTAAEQHRAALVAAQSALEAADDALQAAHDAGAADAEITKLEAAKAASKLAADRAEARYIAAEKRLTAAQKAAADTVKADALARRDEALAVRAKAAAEIDRLAALIAAQVSVYDAQNDTLAVCASKGAGVFAVSRGATLASFALEKTGGLPATTGDLSTVPSAAELAARHAGAVRA